MKNYSIILAATLLLLFNCHKSTEPITDQEWGSSSQGLMMALSPHDLTISNDHPGETKLVVKNLTTNPVHFEMYASLNLYSPDSIWRYVSYFNIMSQDMDTLYASSWQHTKSNFLMDAQAMKVFKLDVSKLGWASVEQSYPPRLPFYQKIEKNLYILSAELHIIVDGVVVSNPVNLAVK